MFKLEGAAESPWQTKHTFWGTHSDEKWSRSHSGSSNPLREAFTHPSALLIVSILKLIEFNESNWVSLKICCLAVLNDKLGRKWMTTWHDWGHNFPGGNKNNLGMLRESWEQVKWKWISEKKERKISLYMIYSFSVEFQHFSTIFFLFMSCPLIFQFLFW